MKVIIFTALVIRPLSCGNSTTAGNGDAIDSVSTDSLKNPSFNPRNEQTPPQKK